MIIGISGKLNSGKDTVAQMIQLLSENYNDSDIIKIVKKDLSEWRDETKNRKWKTKRFADTLKDITCMLIGCTRKQLEDREFKEAPLGKEWECWEYRRSNSSPLHMTLDEEEARMEGDWGFGKREMTPRKLMQLLGTDAGREIIHPNIWVNALFAEYKWKGFNEDGYAYSDSSAKEPKWIIPDMRFPNEAKAVRDRDGILIRVNRPLEELEHGMKKLNHTSKTQHPSETALDKWEDWDYIIENDGSLEDLLEKVKEVYNDLG